MKNNNYGFLKGLLRAFTLAEVLIAIAIVGVIAGLVLPTTISRAQNRGFEQSYSRNVQTIEDAVNALIVSENKDFFKSVMFSNTTPSSYDNTSGEFIKKYLKVSRYCGSGTDNAKLCFPSTYFEYNGNAKEIYNPNFAGACAKLKNGASICLQPQIGATGAKGIIDLNGPSGPNVLNRDLRTFELTAKTNSAKDRTQDNVAVTLAPNLGSESSDPCTTDPNSLECCQTISPPSTTCCSNYPSLSGCTVTPPPPPTDPCTIDPYSLDCCLKTWVTPANKAWCCQYEQIRTDVYSGGKYLCATEVRWNVIASPPGNSQFGSIRFALHVNNTNSNAAELKADIEYTYRYVNYWDSSCPNDVYNPNSTTVNITLNGHGSFSDYKESSRGYKFCSQKNMSCKIYYKGSLISNDCSGSKTIY